MSEELVQLTRDLWMWCLERKFHMHGQNLPGNLNIVADKESRFILDRSDWKLDMNIFTRIDETFDSLEVNLCIQTNTTNAITISAGGQIPLQRQQMHSSRIG